jgi:hypothetical protein
MEGNLPTRQWKIDFIDQKGETYFWQLKTVIIQQTKILGVLHPK